MVFGQDGELIRDRTAAYPGMGTPTVSDRHTQDYLVFTGRVGDHNRHGIKVIEQKTVLAKFRLIGRRPMVAGSRLMLSQRMD